MNRLTYCRKARKRLPRPCRDTPEHGRGHRNPAAQLCRAGLRHRPEIRRGKNFRACTPRGGCARSARGRERRSLWRKRPSRPKGVASAGRADPSSEFVQLMLPGGVEKQDTLRRIVQQQRERRHMQHRNAGMCGGKLTGLLGLPRTIGRASRRWARRIDRANRLAASVELLPNSVP
jgi:hypothetical protein